MNNLLNTKLTSPRLEELRKLLTAIQTDRRSKTRKPGKTKTAVRKSSVLPEIGDILKKLEKEASV